MSLLTNARELQSFLEERLPRHWQFLIPILPPAGQLLFNHLPPQLLRCFSELNQFAGDLVTKKNVTYVCELFSAKRTEMSDKTKTILDGIDSSIKDGTENGAVLSKIRESQSEIVDKLAVVEMIVSGLVIMIQCQQLNEAWAQICEAENIIESSRSSAKMLSDRVTALDGLVKKLKSDMVAFAAINSIDLGQFGTELDAEQTLASDSEALNLSRQIANGERERKLRDFQSRLNEITQLYIKCKSMLGNIQVKINGQSVQLVKVKDGQVKSGLINLVFTASNFARFWLSGGVANVSLALIHGGLTVANGVTYKVTDKKLQELAQMFDQLSELEQMLGQIDETVNILREWQTKFVNHNFDMVY